MSDHSNTSRQRWLGRFPHLIGNPNPQPKFSWQTLPLTLTLTLIPNPNPPQEKPIWELDELNMLPYPLFVWFIISWSILMYTSFPSKVTASTLTFENPGAVDDSKTTCLPIGGVALELMSILSTETHISQSGGAAYSLTFLRTTARASTWSLFSCFWRSIELDGSTASCFSSFLNPIWHSSAIVTVVVQ